MSAGPWDGGSAFPWDELNGSGEGLYHQNGGMTLRDYFAAKADIAVYTPFNTLSDALGRKPTVQEMADWLAAVRFCEADAMLKARKS